MFTDFPLPRCCCFYPDYVNNIVRYRKYISNFAATNYELYLFARFLLRKLPSPGFGCFFPFFPQDHLRRRQESTVCLQASINMHRLKCDVSAFLNSIHSQPHLRTYTRRSTCTLLSKCAWGRSDPVSPDSFSLVPAFSALFSHIIGLFVESRPEKLRPKCSFAEWTEWVTRSRPLSVHSNLSMSEKKESRPERSEKTWHSIPTSYCSFCVDTLYKHGITEANSRCGASLIMKRRRINLNTVSAALAVVE